MALLVLVCPARKLMVLVRGTGRLAGKNRSPPSAAGCTAVTLIDSAWAVAGTLQMPTRAKVRCAEARSAGPPKGPVGFRVSTSRQGSIEKNAPVLASILMLPFKISQ